ncbi:MAG: phosphatase PAP2-related protein [Bacteroidetes bacterium]|jgi:hypothetical protein|nr:phosphatase PAP2-related protein [Bacteroidota bacterium]
MESNWPSALSNQSFRKKFIISNLFLIAVLLFFFFILQYAEHRKGFVIEKGWLTGIISERDFSTWIFTCTYVAIITGLIFCLPKPETTLLLIRTYLLLQLFRAITLLLLPLDPPQGIIPLNDPFLHATFYNGRANLKDLFFSGHVATLVMFIPIIPNKWIKIILSLAAFIAGTLLAAQRVHYIVDVVAAPIFAIIAFLLAKKWSEISRVELISNI